MGSNYKGSELNRGDGFTDFDGTKFETNKSGGVTATHPDGSKSAIDADRNVISSDSDGASTSTARNK